MGGAYSRISLSAPRTAIVMAVERPVAVPAIMVDAKIKVYHGRQHEPRLIQWLAATDA